MSKSNISKKKPASKRPSSATRPWVIGGVDYGPAITAAGDLAAWAFELAARDVEEWPEGRRRVRNAREYVLDRMRGRPRSVEAEDILFTAGLLARIFEAELALGMSDMVAILDEIGLPTEVVPVVPRRYSRGGFKTSVVPLPFRRQEPAETSEPRCEHCTHHPRFRNAA